MNEEKLYKVENYILSAIWEDLTDEQKEIMQKWFNEWFVFDVDLLRDYDIVNKVEGNCNKAAQELKVYNKLPKPIKMPKLKTNINKNWQDDMDFGEQNNIETYLSSDIWDSLTKEQKYTAQNWFDQNIEVYDYNTMSDVEFECNQAVKRIAKLSEAEKSLYGGN